MNNGSSGDMLLAGLILTLWATWKLTEKSRGSNWLQGFVHGSGSIKDTAKEEKMRDKPGFEHLKELQVMIKALQLLY